MCGKLSGSSADTEGILKTNNSSNSSKNKNKGVISYGEKENKNTSCPTMSIHQVGSIIHVRDGFPESINVQLLTLIDVRKKLLGKFFGRHGILWRESGLV
jgi:hypothetical protein